MKLAGVTSHKISQNATISSHTMAPGSATFMCRAVTLQAHQPTGSDSRISQPNWAVDSPAQRCNSKNTAHPHSVPEVPGARRVKPEPKPSAIQCAGCAAMNLKVGRSTAGSGGAPAGKGAVRPGVAAVVFVISCMLIAPWLWGFTDRNSLCTKDCGEIMRGSALSLAAARPVMARETLNRPITLHHAPPRPEFRIHVLSQPPSSPDAAMSPTSL